MQINSRRGKVLETSDGLHVLSKKEGHVFTLRVGDIKEGT